MLPTASIRIVVTVVITQLIIRMCVIENNPLLADSCVSWFKYTRVSQIEAVSIIKFQMAHNNSLLGIYKIQAEWVSEKRV